ncbi:MAG: YCF48-related protein [Chloroflexota bacterium]
MQRLFRLSFLVLFLGILTHTLGWAQPQVFVSGRVPRGEVRVFLKDSVYIIDRDYVIAGTLIIEPGTKVKFYPNGRMIDSTGGRIIADGFARATYTANPGGLNPTAPGSGYYGYSDPAYFLYNQGGNATINVDLARRELTVNPAKYGYVFNVVLDTAARRIVDIVDPANAPTQIGAPVGGNNNRLLVTFEQAVMFMAARLKDELTDVNIKMRPWERLFQRSVNVTSGRIQFIGAPAGDNSREWGHIVVLPGARAAFFRNVSFDGFRKDTTVDRLPIYNETLSGAWAQVVNPKMKALTNGSGGAITTFSSRTWIINATFTNNMARNRGGALNILQSPSGFPTANIAGLPNYDIDKNPNITNRDLTPSDILANNPIPRIDNIDETFAEPLSDFDRQAYDDGRLAVYLGRMRNLIFDRNYVQLANVRRFFVGGIWITTDDLTNPAFYPQANGNFAYGGAIYMSGAENDQTRQIEVGFGINKSLKIGGAIVNMRDTAGNQELDYFRATKNFASNMQSAANTNGAKGGAIYVGKYTSLIVAGEFNTNETRVRFMTDTIAGTNSGYYSQGGAIFCENSLGRLQVRGGGERITINNSTLFANNRSGSGGAIFVDGNADATFSPIIGGQDLPLNARDFGLDIAFRNNQASTFGGAIYTARKFVITGSGGVQSGSSLDYDGRYPVIFEANAAGYSGGAITVNIPQIWTAPNESYKANQIIRARFLNNKVGFNELITGDNRLEVRGGGAIYALNADLNLVKATEFNSNEVKNGNGAAVAMALPTTTQNRFFLTDLDNVTFNANGVAVGYASVDSVFQWTTPIPADAAMLTRFVDNRATVDPDLIDQDYGAFGTGATQIGSGTPGTTSRLLATSWTSETSGFAVGFDGTIVRFTKSGTEWNYVNSGTTLTLNDIEFTSDVVGYIVGDRGLIMKTTNGGLNWNMLTSPIGEAIHDVHFVGSQNGWAVADRGWVIMTSNAGANWQAVKITTNDLHGVFFTSTTRGYAVGEHGTLAVTSDGGFNWDFRNVSGLTGDLHKVFFNTAATGWAVGEDGTLIRTANSGTDWDFVNVNTTNDLYNIAFTGINNGFIVGEGGTVLRSGDAGATWTRDSLNDVTGTWKNWNFYDVNFPSVNVGYVVGDYGLVAAWSPSTQKWNEINPFDLAVVDVKRFHQEIMIPENGLGLGGAIYVLDSIDIDRRDRGDFLLFNRVRIQNNEAYTGSAFYSDNFNLKFVLNRSLVTGNVATSEVGVNQNAITGAVYQDNGVNTDVTGNFASSDLASATMYAEVQGPLPTNMYSEAANSIYDNRARFLIRLPDAPNTKGILAGSTGIGFGGTDTLRGNYWGNTEANVNLFVQNRKVKFIDGQEVIEYDTVVTETFFVDQNGETHLPYLWIPTADARTQGPFEFYGTTISGLSEVVKTFNYTPVPLANAEDENTPAANTIPEQLLMSGKIYDIYDKHTDIKTADYSNRRMSPIEDFAVGIPPIIARFDSTTSKGQPSLGKYVRRTTRDPFIADSMLNGVPAFAQLRALQSEWMPDSTGRFYHPIGYPLYLETKVGYYGDQFGGRWERLNNIPDFMNQSVFFVINETTGDYIRVNMTQITDESDLFRARVEIVPDLSRRNPNTLIRRSAQGLSNYGSGAFLLENLYRNAYKEDASALAGRKYHANYTEFATVPNLFSNRPGMPTSNMDQGISNTTFFAGERFKALPANVGDSIRVISRTVLWREGVNVAYRDGISFAVTRSTEPPVFTGNIKTITNERVPEFRNKVFVTEDRSYPAPQNGKYSQLEDLAIQGRDSILLVSAIDTNKFYDPRSNDGTDFSDVYPQLSYTWNVDQNSGLYRWLQADTAAASEPQRWGARGYVHFTGQPINPYVVPGGELVFVGAGNYPPTWRTVDSLRAAGVSEEMIAHFIETFRPYLHAMKYDSANARYLQQDTIDFGSNATINYAFRLFVVDSVPKFIEPGGEELAPVSVITDLATRTTAERNYTPSVYTCNFTKDGKLRANLTDKLRFQVDFNTDDEQEDSWAVNWDYRYGKTAYGFANTAVRPVDNEVIVVDTTDYDVDPLGGTPAKLVSQVRPAWMGSQYIYKYDNETTADPFAVDFTSRGQLNVRIPRAEAMAMLMPKTQTNGALNTDTVFTIVVNDGHSGKTSKLMPVFINIQPEILTNTLPSATEDFDYNPQLTDSNRRIRVFDPNFGQNHTFELIYPNDTRNTLRIDDCYDEAGVIDLNNGLKTTPTWLKINKESGVLYGVPGVTDAPKTSTVTVVVTDEDGLRAYKQFQMQVLATNHPPFALGVPDIQCVAFREPYTATIIVSDRDLLRNTGEEVLTVRLLDANDNPIPTTALDVNPKTISDTDYDDSVQVTINTNEFTLAPEADGKVTVKVEVTDGKGLKNVLVYRIQVSLQTDFVCPVTVRNAIGSFQVLEFGTSSLEISASGVTTGDGMDAPDQRFLGYIDRQLCEFELPPLPPADVFDARWSIPSTNGVHRNIFPQAQKNVIKNMIYKARVQAGGENGSTSPMYPLYISWKPENIPATTDAVRNPTGSKWYLRDAFSDGNLFSFDMANPAVNYKYTASVSAGWRTDDPTVYQVIITDPTVDGFWILHDWQSGAEDAAILKTGLYSVAPNPVSNETVVEFGLTQPANVKIEVVDMLGNVVVTLANQAFDANNHKIMWNGLGANGNKLPAAAYTIRMVAGNEISTYPVVIVR